MAAAEAGVAAMAHDMEEITGLPAVIGEASERSTQEMEAVNQAGESMSARMSVVARYANSIKEPSADMERVAILFSERMATLNAGISAALTMAENTPPEERDEETVAFMRTLVDVAVASREGMEGMASFGALADDMGRMSRYLRAPVRSITSAVRHMGTAISCIDEWERRARALLD